MLDKEFLSKQLVEIRRLENAKQILVEKKLKQIAGIEEIDSQIEDIKAVIEEHARAHIDAFDHKKRLTLPEGVLKFTQSTRVVVDKEMEDIIIETLKDMGLEHCIQKKESLILKALANLADEELRELGIEKVQNLNFSVSIQ